jgi:hypothetical protein
MCWPPTPPNCPHFEQDNSETLFNLDGAWHDLDTLDPDSQDLACCAAIVYWQAYFNEEFDSLDEIQREDCKTQAFAWIETRHRVVDAYDVDALDWVDDDEPEYNGN